jgi:hypothetical protein
VSFIASCAARRNCCHNLRKQGERLSHLTFSSVMWIVQFVSVGTSPLRCRPVVARHIGAHRKVGRHLDSLDSWSPHGSRRRKGIKARPTYSIFVATRHSRQLTRVFVARTTHGQQGPWLQVIAFIRLTVDTTSWISISNHNYSFPRPRRIVCISNHFSKTIFLKSVQLQGALDRVLGAQLDGLAKILS